jgi:cytochrome P450
MCVIVAEYPEIAATGVLYMDLWPLVPQLMSITNPDMSTQILISPNLPKHQHFQQHYIGTLTKGVDMLSSNGDLWRSLRSVYSTGFSAKNISSMAPWFMEEIGVFKRRLLNAADTGQTVELEAYCLDLTLDVISRTAL